MTAAPARLASLFWLLALVTAALWLRWPFLDREIWNLDEGSTFTMAQQVREGAVLYRDAADNRSPLVPYLKAAIFFVAGDWNIRAQHLALAAVMGLCAFGLLDLATRLGDRSAGRWSAGAFTVLIFLIPGFVDTLAVHTEHFVIAFSTLGFCLFVRALPAGGFFSGFVIGLTFAASSLCKQPGVLDFLVAGALLLLVLQRTPADRARLLRLALGGITAFAATWILVCLYFWLNHAWDDFVYYCWTFNTRLYVPEVPLAERLSAARLAWTLPASWIPAALLLAVPALLLALRFAIPALFHRERALPLLPLLVLGWFASGLASTMLSGRDFSHYAIQLVPALSLACGWFLARAFAWIPALPSERFLFRTLSRIALALVLVWAGFSLREFRNRIHPHDDSGLVRLGEFVRNVTAPSDPILVWGYYPEAYAAARRLPSTRYVYTNYITGMIPWTNLSPEIDTRYAVVPNAWENFWRDYRARPPRLILDAQLRGYSKYPLLSQPDLRDEVVDRFAELVPAEPRPPFVRFYHPLSSLALPSATPPSIDETLQVDVSLAPAQSDLIVATVPLPTETIAVSVRLGGRTLRRLILPSRDLPAARFLLRKSELIAHGILLDAVIERPDSIAVSTAIDVARRLVLDLRPPSPKPVLAYGSSELDPLAPVDVTGWQFERRENFSGWSHHGPFSLTFEKPPTLHVLRFAWQRADPGVRDALVEPESSTDLAVQFLPEDGPPQSVFLQRTDGPSGIRFVTALLPPAQPGRLVLSSSSTAALWLADLRGEANGPPLRFGERSLAPFVAFQNDHEPLRPAPDGLWDAHPFARLAYRRFPGMESLVVEYGIRDSLPDERPPHAILEINFVHDDGARTNLLSRGLQPADNPADRGLQSAAVVLPEKGSGDVELRFVAYGGANPANRAYISRVRARGGGPDLILSPDRILLPIDSVGADGTRVRHFTEHGWVAHAPSRVTYECPPELHAVTFGFHLDDNAIADEHGHRRSDGIEAIIEFVESGRDPVTLYRRALDPYSNPEHRGLQHARVVLPGRAGRLIVRLSPGRNNNESFDWSYLTALTGELATEASSGDTTAP